MRGTVVNVVAASCASNTIGKLGSHETATSVGKHGYAATAARKRRGWFIRLASGSRLALRRESMFARDVEPKKHNDSRRVPNARVPGFAVDAVALAVILMVVAATFAAAPGIVVDVLRKMAMDSTATGIPKADYTIGMYNMLRNAMGWRGVLQRESVVSFAEQQVGIVQQAQRITAAEE